MAIICPTVTAYDLHEYRKQVETAADLSNRLHIDLMDGQFASTISPDLNRLWWPHEVVVDVHLMYQSPMNYIDQLIKLKPRMVIIHAEADVDHMRFVAELHKANILAGLALLQDTPIENVHQIMHSFDHILVFSGKLGHHGGTADLALLEKVQAISEEHPDVEIGWDGGISDDNSRQLVEGGVDVLNVGGFIQNSSHPKLQYEKISDTLL